ncbi:MAG: class I SAM-dependent methyltransferase [Thermoplasmata archaeon]|nr:class I SAM-dependent methyltransferase [Thermoplasmata archaeon]
MPRAVLAEYTTLAPIYDEVYAWKDYERDVREIRRIVRRSGRPGSRTLLDVGCGTGHHLRLLRGMFRCTGLDRSPSMLRIARRHGRGVRWVRGDMERFELGEEFDVVTCLFGAIGYVRTLPRLRKTIRTLARHLRAGGVLIVDPWLSPEVFRSGHLDLLVHDTPQLKIARVGLGRRRGRTSTIDFGYAVGQKGGPIRVFRERHTQGLFSVREQLAAMEAAGLAARFERGGFTKQRGLFVGVRRSSLP